MNLATISAEEASSGCSSNDNGSSENDNGSSENETVPNSLIELGIKKKVAPGKAR